MSRTGGGGVDTVDAVNPGQEKAVVEHLSHKTCHVLLSKNVVTVSALDTMFHQMSSLSLQVYWGTSFSAALLCEGHWLAGKVTWVPSSFPSLSAYL